MIDRKGQDNQDRQSRHDEQDKDLAHLAQSSREADLVFSFKEICLAISLLMIGSRLHYSPT